jgi:hypothetical protein
MSRGLSPNSKTVIFIALVLLMGVALIVFGRPYLDYLTWLTIDCDPLNDFLTHMVVGQDQVQAIGEFICK